MNEMSYRQGAVEHREGGLGGEGDTSLNKISIQLGLLFKKKSTRWGESPYQRQMNRTTFHMNRTTTEQVEGELFK